jgi:hemerythrin
MQRGKYPSFDEHKGQHATFIAEVARQVHDIETEGNPDPADFVEFLTEWVSHHIAVSDKKLAPYIANLR